MFLEWLDQIRRADKARPQRRPARRPAQVRRALRIESLEDRAMLSIVGVGTGAGNTTPPPDDPGFANVGVRGGASAVYLGDGWVLTAGHVGAGSTYFNNILYNAVANSAVQIANPSGVGSSTYTELLLYQIDGRPNLPSLAINSTAPAVGWQVTMIGYGRDRQPGLTYWDSGWTPSGSPSTYSGYTWAGTQSMRWGTNVIDAANFIQPVGHDSEMAFVTSFSASGGTAYEAQGASGDSGGAVFHKNATTGQWELTGIMFQIQVYAGQPAGTAVFGNYTYAADLSPYRSSILNTITVNDAPAGANKTVTTQANVAYTFTNADFGFSDPSDIPANNLLAVRIATLPGSGSLTNNNVAVASGQFISAADIAGGKLKFTPAANASGAPYASFTFQVQDNGGTTNGGVDLDPTPNTITVNVTPLAATTYSLFNNSGTPTAIDSGDGQAIEVGVKIRSDVNGYITGLRFYKSAANTGTHTAHLWSSTGQLLATATFTSETASGWQQVNFATPVAIAAGVTYVASYHTPTGHYSTTRNFFGNGVDSGPLHALANGTSSNGVYAYGTGGFPTQSYQSTNYWVDAVLSTTPPVDTTAPTVSSFSPAGGATNVATSATASITFSEAMDPATINGSTVRLLDGATPVAATVSYNAGTNTATLTPSAALANSKTYTIAVTGGASGVKDLAGNALAATVTSSFTTAAVGATTYSLFNNSGTPTAIDSGDGQAIEVGVKIRSDVNGYITGLRFYKSAANTGTHTAHLWSSTGQLLATATFSGETASGWQQVNFATPVAIAAGVTYVASYHTPTGHYSTTRNFYGNGVDSGPLHALANGVSSNGVYAYGTGGFPTQSYQSTNYWVDAVLSTTPPVDTTAPTVSAFSPAGGATNVATSATASITFSEAMDPATINGSTVRLLDGATPVAATVSYNAGTNTATLTPSAALANSKTYTIAVTGGASGVKDLAGNALAATVTSSFTTAAVGATTYSLFNNSGTPTAIDSGDGQAIEVGVKIRSDVNGYITGLRFYKSAANTGVHTAHLWSSTGQLLATATFTGETASGWQQVNFATPVAIAAGVTYVASYHTTSGHYSATRNFFGAPLTSGPLTALVGSGVYAYGAGGFPTQTYQATNYWIDAVFSTV